MKGSYTGSDLFVEALEQYEVEYLFGNPGTTELPIMESLSDSDIDYILTLHEDIAVGMASGYASTRRYHSHRNSTINPVGVVNLHATPGLAHGLGNIYGASVAGTPLVVTAGNHSTDFRHEEPILSGNIKSMADQFTKWSDEVLNVSALPTMLRRAFRVALTPPTGPVFLGLPMDVMREETNKRPESLGSIPDLGQGNKAQIKKSADLLAQAEEPVMIVGDQIARSGPPSFNAAVKLAEAAGLRVHGEILGAEVAYPGKHDQWVSFIPPDEEKARAAMDTDTILFVGCSTNTTTTKYERKLLNEDTTCLYISNDSWEIGKNNPATSAIIGHPGLIMEELAKQIDISDEKSQKRLQQIDDFKNRFGTNKNEKYSSDKQFISKSDLVKSIQNVAPDSFIVDEGVTSKYEMISQWQFDKEQWITNKGGGLGYGLPATLGAALAESSRPNPRNVIGFLGDGAYLYYPHSVYTARRYGLDLTIIVSNNRNYRILKENTIDILGGQEEDYSFHHYDFDPAVKIDANADSHGVNGHFVAEHEALEPTLTEAINQNGTNVVDVQIDD
jgi:benzoylformate decarboxylase